MTKLPSLLLAACVASPVLAEETRQLDAHEHGVGQLDIAIEGSELAMELHAPGADIVGFEYEAKSAEDRAAIDNAVAILARPLDLFVIADAAGCTVVKAAAGLETEDMHDDHDEHGHDDHHDEHKEHAEDDHDDHDDHKEHAEDDHDDHDDHKEHAHDDHDDHDEHAHDEHADEAGHTEFHAEYLLNCADPAAIGKVTFAYFETFPNALELEVQVISATGASAFEVERDDPTLDLSKLF